MTAGTHIVLHYHEIALKGRNRPRFVSALVENVREATRGLGVADVRALPGRLLVTLAGPRERDGADLAALVARLRRVFGIVSLAVAYRTTPTLEELAPAILARLDEEGRRFPSFRITTRRADKTFPLTSQEINTRLGAIVQRHTGARVDLDEPAFTVWIELLPREALFYFGRVSGPGGLPVGTSGRVVCLISGGIDSPVAAYRMMKRGCPVVFVHYHSEPYQGRAARDKVRELVDLLTPCQNRSRLYLVPFGEIQKEISVRTHPELRVVLYRRMMVRIGERIAREEGALALATGESIGQVASQTLENLAVIEQAVGIPILRPLIGMDKDEIVAQAQAIGTFETSILPDEDCCQLFVPRHPATRSRAGEVAAEESALELEALIGRALEGREIITYGGRAAEKTAPGREEETC